MIPSFLLLPPPDLPVLESLCHDPIPDSASGVIGLDREYENFPAPQFAVGEWVADGLILGLRYDPLTREWFYWIETPELEPSTRWWAEGNLERSS